jgi:phage tail-like protein
MTSPATTTGVGGDFVTSGRFLIEIQGVEVGIFSSVSGLSVTVETVDIPEGGQNGFTHKVPGRMSWPNVTFSRGLTNADYMFEWLQKSSGDGFAAAGNKIERRTVSITALDSSGHRLRTWNCVDAFPVRWRGPDFSVDDHNPLGEELEIAHHGFTSETKPQG